MIRRWCVVTVVMFGCGGDDDGPARPQDASVDAVDAPPDAFACKYTPPSCSPTSAPAAAPSGTNCNVLTQSGCTATEKCTWIRTSQTIGCAPAGNVERGCACSVGSTGTDDCAKGLFCSLGICKAICDLQGGSPQCPVTTGCTSYANTFGTSSGGPAAAGVCDPSCDPLRDSNFLGTSTFSGCCGSNEGCYGYPSYGTPPATGFACTLPGDPTLVHRSTVPSLGGTINTNTCADGYLPLLYEQSASTTIICVALCKPLNCWAGNCGTNNENRHGAAPHRCNSTDRRGTFDTTETGEHCQFMWWREVSDSGMRLPSPYADSLGVCFDFSKYRYDSTGDNKVDNTDLQLPPCSTVGSGFGSGSDRTMPTTYFGALDLGCADSTHLPPMAQQRERRPLPFEIRTLYRRTVSAR